MPAAARFDEVVHGAVRLRVSGMLARLGSTEFALLRDTLQVSDPTLSKHLKQLEQAGYVQLLKGPGPAGRTRTWAELTAKGLAAFDGHVAFLRDVIDGGLRRGKRQGTDVVPLAAASLPSPSPAVTDGRSREYLACKGTTGCERVAGT